MDPEQLELFIAESTPDEIADKLRDCNLALRSIVATAESIRLPVNATASASSW